MKKLLSFLCVAVLCFLFVFSFGACQEQHVHVFDKQVELSKFLRTPATQTEKATYYKSCSCGEKGTEYFYASEDGAPVSDENLKNDNVVEDIFD